MGQNLERLLSSGYRKGKMIIGLWLIGLVTCILYLLTAGVNLKEIELTGATHTDAAEVQRILTRDFNYKLGGSAALVLPAGINTSDLQTALVEEFPEIQQVVPVNTEQQHKWQLLKVFFEPNYTLPHLQEKTNSIRQYLGKWQHTHTEQKPIWLTGSTAFQYDTHIESKKDTRRSENLALLLSLAVLILTFGSLTTALLPLIMGAASLVCFYVLMVLIDGGMSPVSRILVSLMGLALSVDYALFMVSRFKEERQRNKTTFEAWKTTLKHTGSTVIFSGLIMLCSLSALLIPDVTLSRSLMLHLILIIVIAMFHALVILPLCLVYGEPLLEWPRPLSHWIRQQAQKSKTFWQRFSAHVVHRAPLYFGLSLLCIVVLVWPLKEFKLWSPVNAIAPGNAESTQAYAHLQKDHWEGELLPIIVVYQHENVFSPEALKELHQLHNQLQSDAAVYRVQSIVGTEDLSTYQGLYNGLQAIGFWGAPEALRQLVLPESPQQTLMYIFPKDTRSPSLHTHIKERLLRESTGFTKGRLLIGGVVERVNDFTHELYRQLPLMLGLIIGGVFILLSIHLRSIVLPIKAALINFVPILGAFGMLVTIFQWGWGQSLLHTNVHGSITDTVPLILFCLVFGLSMDYEVLMISRMHEHFLKNKQVKPAIIEGLAQSGSLITSAVLILVGVFLPGCFSRSSQTQEICIGIVCAMLIDATLVRLFLVPSFMTLMGRWNWWPHKD